ncbi:MAG: coproporphyrinogen dehydrogenase HemZ [Clostridiales bacterium]|nr:coproporphyrinogen dehydrogenase HemZ [Clostridiales bacterium]
MYKIVLHGIKNKYGFDELVKIFLHPDNFTIFYDEMEKRPEELPDSEYEHIIELTGKEKNDLKIMLYNSLSEITGIKHEWGILTGVRPVKLAGELIRKLGSNEAAKEKLTGYYLLSEEKADLIIDIYNYQQEILSKPPKDGIGMYIGIPFCPTRCLYCAFASNKAVPAEIERYLVALHKEIDAVSAMMNEKGIYPESIYIGGGTPTTLNAEQLDGLMKHVNEAFDVSKIREFTVEAGRPDTIDKDKLEVIRNNGGDRISINPQTMKNETLEIIGRSHKSEDIIKSFEEAHEVGIPCINADLIAGLQGEDENDFAASLLKMIELGANNITVHTLSVKKASRLIEEDKYFHFKQAEVVRKQLAVGRKILKEHGYRPYYLYRQKNMAGGLENTGYCKDDLLSPYNIRIMEEEQTIVALGAGGISKRYYPEENRLERVPNVTNYQIYIERLDEMIQRKEDNLF